MPVFASLLAALIPMLVYLLLIWWMDKYDREPFPFLFIHFLWGAFGAVIISIIGNMILLSVTGDAGASSKSSSLIQTIFFAPFSEEIAKGLFLLYSINSRHFDNITDGIVYGAAIGLGFGMTENFIYFLTYGDSFSSWIYLVLVRSLFSAVMHCISTATFGAFLAIAKFSSPVLKRVLPIAGLSFAMLIHFLWNATISFETTFFYGFIFMIFLALVFFFVFRLSIKNEKYIVERELFEESNDGLIPEEHIKILSSHLRFRKGWIDEKIRKLYCRYAIRLAFSKNQFKNVKDGSKDFYAFEIEKNRQIVGSLLKTNTLEIK
ncbi:MAG: PrsW family intramembrane metalloprotease [Ignavibacteriales bacterium]|nr:PrsW family intramembrane metalloprotease [Ignavibacteriales bacterium]